MSVSKKNDFIRPRLFERAGSSASAQFTELRKKADGPEHVNAGGGFSIRVPQGWCWEPSEEPGVFGRIEPKERSGPRIIVRMDEIHWEIDRLGWLIRHCEKKGVAIDLARPHIEDSSGFEVSGTLAEERWRSVALFRGRRVVLCEVQASSDQWDRLDCMRIALRSFRLLSPAQPRSAVEALRVYRTPCLVFAAPASFKNSHELDASTFSLTAGGVQGLLRVDSGKMMIPVATREMRILGALAEAGWVKSEQLSLYPSGLRTFSGLLEGGMVDRDGRPFLLRIAHRRIGMVYIDYTTVTPQDENSGMDSMRIMRASEIAIDTTRLHGDDEAETVVVPPKIGDEGA